MSNVPINVYQLLEGMLEGGLPFVAERLAALIGRPIIITDYLGKIHYPDGIAGVDDMFVKFPPNVRENDSYYHPEGIFYYHIGNGSASAYVMIKNLPSDMVSRTVFVLNQAKLAIKYYFLNLDIVRKNREKIERELGESLFFQNNGGIRNTIKLERKDLNVDKPYFVSILEVDEADYQVDWQLLRSYSLEFVKKAKLEIIPITWPNCLIAIVPARFKKDTLEVDPEWPRLVDSIMHKEAIEKRFNIIASKGEGGAYPLPELYKSYYEARIALTLPRLMGKKGFVQRFSDLGIFTLLFSRDAKDAAMNYCRGVIGKIIDYDKETDGELLPTLRTLLDTGVNWKTTADKLAVHVNTLYYRINKVEQLLKIDFSKMNTRVNLYIAIKLWDTLRVNGFLE